MLTMNYIFTINLRKSANSVLKNIPKFTKLCIATLLTLTNQRSCLKFEFYDVNEKPV